MKNDGLKRRAFLAGANLVALMAATDALAEVQEDDLDTARGSPGDQVSVKDFVEIQQLYNRYCHALDTGNADAFADCYTEDGEFVFGRGPGKGGDVRTPIKGRETFRRIGRGGGSRHFTANLVVTKTDGGAKGSCYLILYDVKVIPPVFVETAIYDDTLVKTSKGWRFKKRIVWRDDDDITPFKPAKDAGPR